MMLNQKRILVVDDDVEIRELLKEYLTKSGYEVITAQHGQEMKTKLAVQYPDLILLDVMLPGEDGFSLCKHVRQHSHVPIIMLTAVSNETDHIVGLELGADDYIAKPFSPRQLVARIRALLRRTQPAIPPATTATTAICFENWRFEPNLPRLIYQPTLQQIELTHAEISLLTFLLENPQRLLDRNAISQAIRGRDAQPQERGIDVQVSRLRQRLKDKHSNIIKTVRGNGYMFVAELAYDPKPH